MRNNDFFPPYGMLRILAAPNEKKTPRRACRAWMKCRSNRDRLYTCYLTQLGVRRCQASTAERRRWLGWLAGHTSSNCAAEAGEMEKRRCLLTTNTAKWLNCVIVKRKKSTRWRRRKTRNGEQCKKAKAKVKSGSCVANVTRWPQACYVHIPERGGLTPPGAPSCQFCGLQDAVLARDWCEKSGRRRRDPFMVGCKPGLVASPPATCCGS